MPGHQRHGEGVLQVASQHEHAWTSMPCYNDLHNLLSCTSRISSVQSFHSQLPFWLSTSIPKQWPQWLILPGICINGTNSKRTPKAKRFWKERINASKVYHWSRLQNTSISVNHFNKADGLWQVKMWSGCVVAVSSSSQTLGYVNTLLNYI